ncbi:MAG TPA: hypothetical protein PLW75_05145 [Hyphomicrobium sp.]|nr:hypothetical protein [Hyphomicrobium sp.]
MSWKPVITGLAATLGIYAIPISVRQELTVSHPSEDRPVELADWPEQFATPEALTGITTKRNAATIISAARLVSRHFTYANNWQETLPAPPEWVAYFSTLSAGYCDDGARVFADVVGQGFETKNYNMVTHLPRKGQPGFSREVSFRAHTASAIKLERGAVLIDPMYGVLLVTKRDDFSNAVFMDKDFKVYSLYTAEDTPERRAKFTKNASFYQNMTNPRAYSAYSGERLKIHQSAIEITPFGSTIIGELDDSAQDVTDILGMWGNHVGYWYEPSTDVWVLKARWPGIFEIRMDLIDGDGAVLGIPLDLDVGVEGGVLLRKMVESRSLVIRYAAFGKAKIKTRSTGMSGRLIDRIVARQLPF